MTLEEFVKAQFDMGYTTYDMIHEKERKQSWMVAWKQASDIDPWEAIIEACEFRPVSFDGVYNELMLNFAAHLAAQELDEAGYFADNDDALGPLTGKIMAWGYAKVKEAMLEEFERREIAEVEDWEQEELDYFNRTEAIAIRADGAIT